MTKAELETLVADFENKLSQLTIRDTTPEALGVYIGEATKLFFSVHHSIVMSFKTVSDVYAFNEARDDSTRGVM